MIVSEIFDIPINSYLTKKLAENFFTEKKINPVKWSIVGISKNKAKVLTSFEKKTL